MEQAVAATASAIENERWVAGDDLYPNTVEFWIEDFKRLLQSGLYRDGGRKEEQVLPPSILKYMRFVFKHLLTSTWSVLEALRPAIEQVLALGENVAKRCQGDTMHGARECDEHNKGGA
jgi:hypothetical protein